MTVATAEQTLQWESRHRSRAAIAAALGGVLTLAGVIYNSIAVQDAPNALFLDSLARLAQPGSIGTEDSLKIDGFQYYDSRAVDLLLSAGLIALGFLALSGALTFLAFATRHRTDRLPRIALYLPLVGGVLTAIGVLLGSIGTVVLVNDLLATQGTVDAVRDVDRPLILYVGGLLGGVLGQQALGSLFVGAAFILTSLHAMRVGLLTKFMGMIGIFVGILLILPLVAIAPILQPFWLISLAALFLGRWPGGVPAAWRTGKAEPWPTAAQMREERMKQANARRPKREAPGPQPDTSDNGEATMGKPHPASKKRKRKRRG